MIEVAEVTHRYGARTVLRDVSVRLTERRVGIIGANGSGKSTFVRLLNGLVVPAAGRVSVDGLDTRRDAKRVWRLVGFCFTDPDAQIVLPTVAEDVGFGLRRRGLSRAEVATRVRDALARFDLLDHADHPTHLLSGGQKQLLALAAVLITEPDVLVLDEPTTLLDLRNAHRVARHLDALDLRVLLVTHHLELVGAYERVLVFDEGRIVYDGPPDEAVAFYTELMGG